jgi:Skp family chaperone for outer membrane proteins
MRSFRRFGPFAAAGAATVLLLAPEPGAAQSNAELMNIIRQQQRQIEELSRKVDALQSQVQQATEEADAAAITARQTEQDAPDMSVEWGPGPTPLEPGRQLVGTRARTPPGRRRRAGRR